jgi:hypothetical protein
MYNIRDLDSLKKDELINVINKSDNSTAFHSLDFNLYISDYFELQTFILVALLGKKIQGFLIFHRKANDKLITSPYQLSLSVYGGPVSLSGNYKIIGGLLKHLKKYSRNGSIYIKSGYKISSEIYKKSGYKVQIIPTLLINTDRTENEIWKNIDNRIRRNIKKAVKNNIEISVDDQQNIDSLIEIYKDTCERKGLYYHEEKYYKNLYRILHNDVRMKIYYAKYNGTIVSAMSVLEFKDLINPWFGGTKAEFMETGAGSMIYWEILRYACSNRYRIFDFLGLDIGPVAFYKKGFGGEEAEVCHASYTPVYIRILSKARKILLR